MNTLPDVQIFINVFMIYTSILLLIYVVNIDRPIFKAIDVPQEPKREGETAILYCDVTARPQPTGFVKLKRDKTVIIGSVFDEHEGRLRYNIQNITRHDAGSYLCEADNGIGNSSTKAIDLIVFCKFVSF